MVKREKCSKILLLPLNDDVVFEKILPWLPPESLLKFRSVSKSWYSAISDPDFIAKHRSHYGDYTNGFVSLLFTQKHDSVLKLRHIPEQQNQNLPAGLVIEEHGILFEGFAKASSGRYRIMASCNGLFCYASRLVINDDDHRIYLCNPSIRWTRAVVPFHFSTDKFARHRTYGVGFDRCTNDYKLIMLEKNARISGTPRPRPIKAAVYSVKSNSWKRLNNVTEPPFHGFDTSIFLHGFIHWLEYTYSDKRIVLFDVGNEVFGEIKLPIIAKYYRSSRYGMSISAVRGSLCFLSSALGDGNKVCCHMWIMKEYGIAESWTKQAVIEFELLDIKTRPVISTQATVGATVGGKIICDLSDYVCGLRSKLALFDPLTSQSQYLNMTELWPPSYRGVVSLVPTLELLDVIMT